MKGRRLPDVTEPDHIFPPGYGYDDLQPGDIWRLAWDKSDASSNLTGTVWMFRSPHGQLGKLSLHTIREHDDGTVSIRPNDGSSNSILIGGGGKEQWHGYVYHNEWTPT